MKKILLVEDDVFIEGIMVEKIAKEGYVISTAMTVPDALRSIQTKQDLVILDLTLPGGDGYQVLESLRKNPDTAATPVLIFSNITEEKYLKKAKDLGATDFMVKSNFTLDEVMEKIKELIG